ncbi:MAG: hypothetical protein E6Q88_07805 [Lysobacteraceae bacterium]|nr:MAG: hypothetical protein E6Q88_07805 [Xanthomonadaceae bacterium]
MRPLSTDALKFTSDLSTVVRDGKAYRRLTLRYYIDDAKRKANLLQIDLEDTEPSATGQPLQSGGPPEAVDPLRFCSISNRWRSIRQTAMPDSCGISPIST